VRREQAAFKVKSTLKGTVYEGLFGSSELFHLSGLIEG
jgi:hypothetical protein